ncbi:hypothetical protein MOSE0_N06370 [Monosporozyma servazzii]
MDTFQISVYNFTEAFHFKLHLKNSQKVKISHIIEVVPDYKYKRYYFVGVRGLVKTFYSIKDTVSFCNRNRSAKEIVIFIHYENMKFGYDAITPPSIPTLSVVINRVIQFSIEVPLLPLTFEALMDLINQTLKMNSMKVDWQELILDLGAYPFSTKGLESKMDYLNEELEEFGEAKLFLTSVTSENESDSIANGKIEEATNAEVSCAQENLNEIVEGIERLETSIRKSSKHDIFINIPLQDEELFEFYNKIKTEEQLVELKHSFEKYQQGLTLDGADENKVETHLMIQNAEVDDINEYDILSDPGSFSS